MLEGVCSLVQDVSAHLAWHYTLHVEAWSVMQASGIINITAYSSVLLRYYSACGCQEEV